jgi:phytoene dehydrogenase-like protein
VSYRRTRSHQITGQFAPRPIEMLESPGFRVLSRAALMVLARIEIEFAHHGGKENGRLPVTYDDFEEYGVHRHAIRPGIRELLAFGIIVITESGRAGNAEFRKPNFFRLTYRHVEGVAGDGTHEWRKFAKITMEEAKEIARRARAGATPLLSLAKKNKNPVV